ncbi:MAG: hypothetical protein OSJ70_04995 [Bacilli bacterium]|nr:hypothetical protein [Bacilli bacterium]
MQENINSNEIIDTTAKENQTNEVVEEKATDTIEEKKEETKETLPKRSIKLENGTIINNLKITYKNLFDFQNSYDNSKDLMEALVKKETFEHEVMIQLIYVAYLGTNPTDKMEYFDFIDAIPFDYKRDMKLFGELTGIAADSKN